VSIFSFLIAVRVEGAVSSSRLLADSEVFSFSAELRLRVPTLEVRGVVTTFAFLTGRGREGLVWHASCRREKAGWDAKFSMPQRGQLM